MSLYSGLVNQLGVVAEEGPGMMDERSGVDESTAETPHTGGASSSSAHAFSRISSGEGEMGGGHSAVPGRAAARSASRSSSPAKAPR
jgi:hypothetical protein